VAGDSEKGPSAPERAMKTSLMNVLRMQIEKEGEAPDVEVPGGVDRTI